MNIYSHSALKGYKLNTGKQARQARAAKALSAIGRFPCFPRCELLSTGQNSSSILAFPTGVRVLVSYETAVAFRHSDGSFFATPRGEFSWTTDRAVADFAPLDCIRLDCLAFAESLRRALK